VHVLQDFHCYLAPQPLRGRDVNSVLRTVFDVSERSDEFIEKIASIDELLDQEDLAGAELELETLAQTLGEDDPEIVRLRTIVDFRKTPIEPDDPSDHESNS